MPYPASPSQRLWPAALLAAFLLACGGDEPAAPGSAPSGEAGEGHEEPVAEGDAPTDAEPLREPGTSSVTDVRLATEILLRFVADDTVDARRFDVVVEAGAVTLTPAAAASEREIERARALALGMDGVTSVSVGDGAPVAAPTQRQEVAAAVEAIASAPLDEETRLEAAPPARDPETQDAGTEPVPSVELALGGAAELAEPTPPAAQVPAADPQRAPQETAPSAEAAGSAADPQPAGDRTYRVRAGDSLSAIARRQLGDGNRLRELYEYNRSVIGPNPDGVQEGMILRLP